MKDLLLTLYDFQLGYIKMLAKDLDDEDLGKSPFPGANPPVWILGHLAVCTDYAARLLGERPVCPKEWHKQFAPGSKPAEVAEPYPTTRDLVGAIIGGHERVAAALREADLATLNEPNAIELLKASNLKTNADVLGHLITTHVAFHVAQLSACRRGKGLGPVI